MLQLALPGTLRRSLFAATLACSLFFALSAQPAHAACGGSTDVGTAAALNAAINDFNAQAGPCAFTITLSNDIALTASTPPISNSNSGAALTIAGMGHTVDGQDISGVRPFTINSGTTVTLEEITITRGKIDNASSGGGGIYTNGMLTLMDSSVIDNATVGDGGGIYQEGGTLTLIGSSVTANTGGFSAAGIYQNAGTLTVTDSTITDNIGVALGGGLHSAAGTATVTNSTVAGNGAIFGGGIYNEGSLTVRDSEFTDNRSVTGGGGIYNFFGTLDVSTTTLSGNVAGTTVEGVGKGGGVYTAQGAATIATSTFTDNRARIDGGGIYHDGGALNVTASTFIANQAQSGGGLHNISTVTVTNSTFSGNIGNFAGGGIYNQGILTLISSTVAGNSGAANQGGGVVTNGSVGSGTLNLNNSVIANNTNGDCLNLSGRGTVSAAYTLIRNSGTFGCDLAAANPDSSGNHIGVDPLLGPLADNGGSTQTHTLLAGSPAIDAIPTAIVNAADSQALNLVCNGLVPATDQIGTSRPQGNGCDIGSVEVGSVPLAITLGWFLAAPAAGAARVVDFRWQTVSETGTAGFNLLAVTEAGKTLLNPTLIPSPIIDSLTPTDYAFSMVTDATLFYLQEVGIDGGMTEHGPFELGVEHGSYTATGPAELPMRVWLPVVR